LCDLLPFRVYNPALYQEKRYCCCWINHIVFKLFEW
jgi:hypothetical protein